MPSGISVKMRNPLGRRIFDDFDLREDFARLLERATTIREEMLDIVRRHDSGEFGPVLVGDDEGTA